MGQLERLFVTAALAAVFGGITLATEPTFVGDAPYYAVSSVAGVVGSDCRFLEPGHLLWRPIGFAVLKLSGVAYGGAVTDRVLDTSQAQLAWIAWLAALCTILAASLWLQKLVGPGAAAFGVFVLVCSKAFLNYSQVGTSYVPALAFLMSGLLLLHGPASRRSPLRSLAAGACLGISVLIWGTFVFALPAALAFPILFTPNPKRAMVHSGVAAAGGGLVGLLALGWVWTALRFRSLADGLSWIATADHDIALGGTARAIGGFARSFVHTGDYGRLVRRFFLADSADPVQPIDLITLPLFGIVAFYCGLLLALIAARRHPLGKRVLAFLAINGVPVAAFAVVWQGGDLERYLPLTPAIILLFATAFAGTSGRLRAALLVWLLILAVPNLWVSSPWFLDREQRNLTVRLQGLGSPTQARLILLPHGHDELAQFSHSHPKRLPPHLTYHSLLTSPTASSRAWRGALSRRIITAWNAQTEVLVPERLLADRPDPSSRWIEGDHGPVSWRDLSSFLRGLDYAERRGVPADGFLVLGPSEANRRLLALHAGETRTPESGGCRLPSAIPPP